MAAEGDNGMGVEAAVGPHREWSAGPGMAHPYHRLSQEVSGAPTGVDLSLPQPRHQQVAGASGHGQQWVIAPLPGIVSCGCEPRCLA